MARIERRRDRRAEVDVAEAEHEVARVEDDALHLVDRSARPLMRRMNSMLLGHQGASGRTDCVYFSMASCVAGSSHDSGRCTMRVGTSIVVDARAVALGVLERARAGVSRGSARPS